MFKRRSKPKEAKIDLKRTIPQEIEYFCKTSSLDKYYMEKQGKEFNQILSEAIEKEVRFYFVVKKNQEYNIIPGPEWEKFIEEHSIEELPLSDKAIQCREHFLMKAFSR